MKQDLTTTLRARAYQLRCDVLRATSAAGSGHPTSCLSAADILSVLFFGVMKCDYSHFLSMQNDRFILSKGHAAPLLYAVWKQLGIVSDAELLKMRTINSPLEGHPTPRALFCETATGSLGQGLSMGVGMACATKMKNSQARTFVLLGDGECAEGQVWEAAEVASYYHLGNLIALVDVNRLGQSDETLLGNDAEAYQRRFSAFGWNTIVVDGHDIDELISAFQRVDENTQEPLALIAKTRKGAGLNGVIEDTVGYHGKAFSPEELEAALLKLKQVYGDVADFVLPRPAQITVHAADFSRGEKDAEFSQKNELDFSGKQLWSTREAAGLALAAAGEKVKEIVCLDGDVKNSTYTNYFEKKFPERFVQCFIAEQNMVSMGIGFAARGFIPFMGTFSAFFSRAYDQIRMAAIGRSPLRLLGSHAGVSIGQDGPSQMGLEDIAMMRAIPDSIVLYPSDAVSAAACVELVVGYEKGISYVRTTRMETPQLYENVTEFVVGGGHVLRKSGEDHVCVVAAGITVHEALKAYQQLIVRGINIRIIDCYSIKPLPATLIKENVEAAHNRLVVVEDHYAEGGLGEAIFPLFSDKKVTWKHGAVRKLPRSGTPAELLSFEEIDAAAIIRFVEDLL